MVLLNTVSARLAIEADGGATSVMPARIIQLMYIAAEYHRGKRRCLSWKSYFPKTLRTSCRNWMSKTGQMNHLIRIAASREVISTSLSVALVVGTILVAINYGDRIIARTVTRGCRPTPTSAPIPSVLTCGETPKVIDDPPSCACAAVLRARNTVAMINVRIVRLR